MPKLVIGGTILLVAGVVFVVAVLLIRLRSRRSFESIWRDRANLFYFSLKLAIALLVIAIAALVIHNN